MMEIPQGYVLLPVEAWVLVLEPPWPLGLAWRRFAVACAFGGLGSFITGVFLLFGPHNSLSAHHRNNVGALLYFGGIGIFAIAAIAIALSIPL